ncbi:MAG: hypothetical protein QG656_992 [Candidatus Hydrogenedentes bacterium]|nr:hypothetical protein [Candidatus Hydrogenedentota bacterium]
MRRRNRWGVKLAVEVKPDIGYPEVEMTGLRLARMTGSKERVGMRKGMWRYEADSTISAGTVQGVGTLASTAATLVLAAFAVSGWADTGAVGERGALAGERFRVIVSSDIGGSDNDDCQSMAHFLIYADVFDVEGLIASPPGDGRAKDIYEVIDAYEIDYPGLSLRSKVYPAPERLRGLDKQGAADPAPAPGFSDATDGSRWIAERVKAADGRPLYVLVWGSITDVAQAVHDDPSIKNTIRVYSIGAWNTHKDPASRDYLFRNHPDLWWIEADTTFRGMYVGGNQDGDLGNKTFLDRHVRGHGALGDYLVAKLDAIKMGDTPTVLYLLRGDPGDPTAPHWGGSFVKTDHGPHYWTDSADPRLAEGEYPGAKTVNVWREDYLRDWGKRMEKGGKE